MADRVLVTGGSGYVAGFIIRQLINEGWDVNTTIRNLSREAEVRSNLAVDNDRVAFFQADLTGDVGWADAMAGCRHVLHVASPFPADAPRHEDELIVPAREGVLRALRFAKQAGVERFVQTSSAAAIAYGRPRGTYTFTEADWTNVESPDAYPYVKSKTIAERAARDWVAVEGGAMQFASVNPSAVLGPVLSGDFSASIELVRMLLDGAMPGCPDFGFAIVDVRDVADMHVRLLTAPDIANERFIAAGPFLRVVDVADILRGRLQGEARKVPTRKLPDWVVKLVALFDPRIRQVAGELGKVRNMDTSHARDKLGWEARPVADSIVDTARSLLDQGLLKA
ncbi:MAG: NAD-dependent epimerase/dehydratase family protein [Blastomonas sp.]